jgi:hypothetical protein
MFKIRPRLFFRSHSDDTPEPLPDQGEDDDDDAPLEVPISKNVLNHDESLVQSPISKTLWYLFL